MKRFYLLLSAVIAFAACQRIGMDVDLPEGVVDVIGQVPGEVIITASIADGQQATRTSYDEVEAKNYWTPGDKIKVFSAGEAAEFTSLNTEPEPIVKFRGYIATITGSSNDNDDTKDYVWGLYPYSEGAIYEEPDGISRTARITTTYPDVQVGVAGTFGDNLSVMVGRSESLSVPFRGAYSGAFFQVNRDDIVSITLRGLNNEVLAGTATLGLNTNMIPVVHSVTDPKTSVTVTAPNGTFEPGENYYLITLPDVALPDGYSVTLVRSDGLGGTYEVRANRPLNRIKFRNLSQPVDVRIEDPDNIADGLSTGWIAVSPEGDLDPDAIIAFADPTVKTLCVSNWDTDGDGELSYAEAAAVTTIPYEVFSSNTNITSFDEFRFFTGVTSLGYDTDYDEGTDYFGAFSGCTNLKSITLPPTLTTIPWGCFRGCSSLEELYIPKSVTKIQQVAFLGCTSLEIHMESETPCTLQGDGTYLNGDPCAFGFLYSIDVKAIYVPDEDAATAYKAAQFWPASRIHPEGWVDPSQNIVFKDAITELICVSLWDTNGDESLSYGEAAAVTDLTSNFQGSDISSFEELQFFSGLTSLPNNAFKDCGRMQSISFPSNLQSIGNNALSGCTKLDKVYVPTLETWIELVSDQIPFSSNNQAGELYVGGVLLTELTLPEGVTSVKDYICNNLKKLERVVIPQGYTSVGKYAFNGCYSLGSVVIPQGITQIGQYSFCNCRTLASVDIPDSVNSIGERAFASCNDLTEVIIPEGVTAINNGAFSGCTSLANVIIPSSVTSISANAFSYCSSIESIIMPDSLRSIGECAFDGCSSLSSINFPEGLAYIYSRAFQGCSSLKAVSLPSTIKTIYSNDSGYTMGGYRTGAFYGSGVETIECYNTYLLESINMTPTYNNNAYYTASGLSYGFLRLHFSTSSVENEYTETRDQVKEIILNKSSITYSIPYRAFKNFKGLQAITLPKGVTSIGGEAFYGCSNLADFTIQNTVTEIGNSAFSGCSSLTSIVIPDSVTTLNHGAFQYCRGLTNLVISESLTSIPSNAFTGCSSLSSVVIPDGVTSIESCAFDGCTDLTTIDIPDSVTSIAWGTFRNCTSLSSIVIPDGVTSIGSSAFDGCTDLTTIDIPDSVTSLADYTFHNCTNLSSVVIPDGVTSIGSYAFDGCSSLTTIAIPDNVTSIANYSFRSCTSLSSVVIPDGVTSIGSYAFSGCSSLSSITVMATMPPTLGSSAFLSTNNCPIYVPRASVDAYKTASVWSTYASRIQAIIRPFPEGNSFDEDAYITYVANHQGWFIIGQDATYRYDTYFRGVSGTRIEMKFQVPDYSSWGTDKPILTSCDDGSGNGFGCDASNVYYWTRRKYREDGEYTVDYTYTNLVDSGIDGTGVIVLSAELNGSQITTSVNGTQKTISSSLTSFDLSYLFSSYYYEHDDGSLYDYSAGVPDGTKLFYVKIWNGDQLVYNGYAGRATNPSNSTEEYCWYAMVNGTPSYTFAYDNTNYPSNYTTLDVYNPIRQTFGGGMD